MSGPRLPFLLPWLRVNLLIRSITERVWHEEVALFRALAALAPAGMLLSGSAALFSDERQCALRSSYSAQGV